MKKVLAFLSLLFLFSTITAQQINDTSTLRSVINSQIVPNSNRAITALTLNRILNGYLNTRIIPYSWALQPSKPVYSWSELTGKPILFDGDYNSLTTKPVINYDSITSAPTNWFDIIDKPVLNIDNWNTAYSWGNHTGLYRPISYVPSWSEITSKPTLFSGNYSDLIGSPTLNITNWNAAYSWGNHAGLYRPSSYVPAWSEITGKPTLDITNWNTAYSWGNHVGLYRPITYNPDWTEITGKPILDFANWNTAFSWGNHAGQYKPITYVPAWSEITGKPTINTTDWNTAYSWGNHAGLYRPLSYVPAWSEITGKPTLDITNWNTAYSWGNHAGLYRPISYVPAWSEITGKPTFDITNWNTSYSWGNHAGLYRPISYVPSWSEITSKPSFDYFPNTGGSISGNITLNNGQYYQAKRNTSSSVVNVLGFEYGTDDLIQVFSNNWKLRNTGTGDVANVLVATVDKKLLVSGAIDNGIDALQVNGSGKFSTGLNITDSYGLNVGNFQVGAITSNRFWIYNNTLNIDNFKITPSNGNITHAKNTGIGLDPYSWNSAFRVLDIGNNSSSAFLYGRTDGNLEGSFGVNAYYDATGWKYKNTGSASNYLQNNGNHSWYTSVSGSANTPISWSNPMVLNNSLLSLTVPIKIATSSNNYIEVVNATHSTLSSNSTAITFSRTSDGSDKLSGIFGWNNGGIAISGREGIVLATGGTTSYSNTIERLSIQNDNSIFSNNLKSPSLQINSIVTDGSSKLETSGNVRNVGNNTASQMIHGSWYPNMSTHTGSITLPATSTTYLYKETSNVTWTLETAYGHNRYYIIRAADIGNVTIALQSGQYIMKKDGSNVTTLTATLLGGAIHLQSDGVSKWYEL